MTLKFIDGFEGYTLAEKNIFWDNFSSGGGGNSISSNGRRGGKCWEVVSAFSATNIWNSIPGIVGDFFIIGFAFNFSKDIDQIVYMGSGVDNDFRVDIVNSQLKFSRNPLVSSINVFTSDPIEKDTWHYLEVKVTCDNSAGKMVGRLNEQELFDYTGDTKSQFSPGYVNKFGFRTAQYAILRIDDIYVCDGQGTKNNDFLGDIRVDTIHPNGAGNYAQLTPSAGNNYECIDEDPFDDSDYVEGITIGNKDSYSYANVPTDLDDSGIFGIQFNTQQKRTAGSDNIKIKGLIRTGSTDYSESERLLTDVFKSMESVWEEDPSDSGDWTQAKINACEFGMEVA